MPPSKLKLKRTPAEQAEHDLRKARKAARKAAKLKRRRADSDGDDDHYERYPHRRKRHHTDDTAPLDDTGDSDAEYGPQPAPSTSGSHRAHKPDYDYIRAQVEEERFQDKLWGAMGDDERLDSVEASLNAYAHVPRRWRGGGMERMDDEMDVDPRYMEDEDYAEWIRAGMWRKKHAAEHEERMRKQAEHEARKAREKAIREETRRLERAEEEERRKRRLRRERLRAVEMRELYETRWKTLLAPGIPTASSEPTLGLADIPWPVYQMYSDKTRLSSSLRLEDLTVDAISAFLLPSSVDDDRDPDMSKKERRERLRDAMLRLHPDKFEGRVMPRVRADEKDVVREAVGVVARTLNTLMAQTK
ncbi:hypothetical protein GSI_01404 [Ganoderma sinense ZZ0214-1]|uniref:Uncharacterized protein n=1 Tax=Ganoderma sinense ZZ0214-1 TaxID=1077348 RepID=A0A2G8SVC9_9APHY|nr:hypothetical protein GSI_01404 [Ganoderma sinense ZZ0214-1]